MPKPLPRTFQNRSHKPPSKRIVRFTVQCLVCTSYTQACQVASCYRGQAGCLGAKPVSTVGPNLVAHYYCYLVYPEAFGEWMPQSRVQYISPKAYPEYGMAQV